MKTAQLKAQQNMLELPITQQYHKWFCKELLTAKYSQAAKLIIAKI